ncbi:amidohydrolase 2 [Xanthobacter versatilis]|uniref:Amidohydrolase 2 n=1 Tax=Xanthobacter autotrophicus (strain ATCC BAA-1158 / Py2) TaxID=78245 RepID=A7IH05_XANP2|nr:amidohydrolase 2 [Xanthobacter autotrophicus Py2]
MRVAASAREPAEGLPASGPIRKIALEEHFTTPDLASRNVARPTRSDALFADIERRLVDFDSLRLETMDRAGISLCVLSVTTPGVQAEKDTATAISLARKANDALAEEVRRQPTRYAGFAHLPMQDPTVAADELERCVRQLGFKGALINGQTNGQYLDADRFLPFWERVADLDVPVYLHPGELADAPAMFAGRPELGGAVWAWTAETASHALRLVFGGTFTRFPTLKVILGHMGETLPSLLWRFDSRWQCALGETLPPEQLPSAIIRRHFAITTSGVCDPTALAAAIAALGEDAVMFSVDYPYEDTSAAAAFIEAAPLDPAVRAKVCHANAERILKL